jgi:DNA-binding response OmpR family regulator
VEVLQFGDFALDPTTQTASLAGKMLELTPSEYSILNLLVQNPDQVFSTESLLVEALGVAPQLGNPQVIHTHIRNLRRKLEPDPRNPTYIRFIRRGYQWGMTAIP